MKRSCLKILCIIFFLVLQKGDLFAQGEFNNWYFGYEAGITFNSGVPVFTPGGQTFTDEGVASVSDASGNLLFYTDGVTVWNRLHAQMPNGFGLNGDFSSTQSALIIKKPGSQNLYYLFTTPAAVGGAGLRYSEVNMNLDGGLGDVTVNKNIFMIGSVPEKLTAVRKSNQTDYWVIVNGWNSNQFRAFSITSAGVNLTPVLSNAGTVVNGFPNYQAELKASPDGLRLGRCLQGMLKIELFDFDLNTGIVSNPILLTDTTFVQPYGCCFSPDAGKFYVSVQTFPAHVLQFDLSSGSAATIIASATVIADHNGYIGSLALGPDHKIYVALSSSSFLGVINDPDLLGVLCNYTPDAVSLNGTTCMLGLPNFIQISTHADFAYSNICLGDSTAFSTIPYFGVDSVYWDFGDPGSGAANNSSSIIVNHFYNNPGIYNVDLHYYTLGYPVDSIIKQIEIIVPPFVEFGNDTILCGTPTFTLYAGNNTYNYVWQNNSTDSFFVVSQPGTYYVTKSNECGVYSDTIYIQYIPFPVVDLQGSEICENQTILLNATNPLSTYLWQDGSTNPTFLVDTAGQFQVTVTNYCGVASDEATFTIKLLPDLELGLDTTICDDELLNIKPEISDVTFHWMDGSTLDHLLVSTTELVILTVQNSCGTDSDSLDVIANPCDNCLFMPNAFSPNGDGINDIFRPLMYCNITSLELKIFNRWGQLVFEMNNPGGGWNGNYHLVPQEPDVYVYQMNYSYERRDLIKNRFVTGNVTLVR